MASADAHNQWMLERNCFNHVCPGEPDVAQRIRNTGYPLLASAENIGQGYQTPEDMVTGWMNSSGHRANILGDYVHIGCSFVQGSGGYLQRYWTCNFARPSSAITPQPPGATVLPGTATPVNAAPSQATWASRTFDEINRRRATLNLAAGVFHPALQCAAQSYSQLMADTNCFTHTCSGTLWTRIPAAGYDAEAYSEVIGKEFNTPEAAVQGWMDSASHRAIITSEKSGFRFEMGCGWDSRLGYATCTFGYRRLNTTPTPTVTRTPAIAPPPDTPTPLPATATPTRLPSVTPQPSSTSAPTSPTPDQATVTATRTALAPRSSPTVTLPPTATMTPTMTQTPAPTRTAAPGSQSIRITAASQALGWVMTLDNEANHLGDDDIYAGKWGERQYYGLAQFNLPSLPGDAIITQAELVLYTQTREDVQGGMWTVQMLGASVDDRFTSLTFPQTHAAPLLGAVASVSAAEIAEPGRANIFSFPADRVADLQARLGSTRQVSFRIDGPPADGATYSLQAWDTGYGVGSLGPDYRPTLRLTFVAATLALP